MKYTSNMSFEEVMQYYEIGELDISLEDLVRVIENRMLELKDQIEMLQAELDA